MNKKMKDVEIDVFVNRYMPEYFNDRKDSLISWDKRRPTATSKDIEKFLFGDKDLFHFNDLKSEDAKYAVAWKVGKLQLEDEHPLIRTIDCVGGKERFKIAASSKNDDGYIYTDDIKTYYEFLGSKRTEIEKSFNEVVSMLKENTNCSYFDACDRFEELYCMVTKSGKVPKHFGSVYVINLLFFLTQGAIPIYDRFAHKAALALIRDTTPANCFIDNAPEKSASYDVACKYVNYLYLLMRLFGRCDITRNIDRALWVFGHSNEKFSLKQ